MKKYCFNCGSKLEFSVKERPKFCPQCGKPLESSSNTRGEEELIEEDFDGEMAVKVGDNIAGLAFEFDVESLKVKTEPLESLMGTLDKASGENTSPVDFPTPSKAEVLEQYKKEAGTLRENRRSEENEKE